MRFPARQTQFTSFYFEFPLALKDNFLLSALGTAVCFNSCMCGDPYSKRFSPLFKILQNKLVRDLFVSKNTQIC